MILVAVFKDWIFFDKKSWKLYTPLSVIWLCNAYTSAFYMGIERVLALLPFLITHSFQLRHLLLSYSFIHTDNYINTEIIRYIYICIFSIILCLYYLFPLFHSFFFSSIFKISNFNFWFYIIYLKSYVKGIIAKYINVIVKF